MNGERQRSGGDGHTIVGKLVRDFVRGPWNATRFIDEIECLASVLLAIGLARLLGIDNVGWAAFSAYMVIRASFADSLRRGSLRVLGTAVGASLAWLLAPLVLRSPASLSAALAVAGAITLYLALLDRRSYAWLFVGLTFAIVLVDGMEHPDAALAVFARSRFDEIVVGTCASILVSAVSTLTVRRWLPPPLPPPLAKDIGPAAAIVQFWHKAALRHALQGAIALALIPWIWTAFHVKSLSQSSITILAVMVVPVNGLVAPLHPATTKLRHRFVGCVIGALLAMAILVLSDDSPMIMTLAVCAGVMVGRHIENGQLGIDYVGTQFALAFLVVLVPDSYTGVNMAPGLERVSGILFGMLLLEPVRLLFRRFAPSYDASEVA